MYNSRDEQCEKDKMIRMFVEESTIDNSTSGRLCRILEKLEVMERKLEVIEKTVSSDYKEKE